MEVKKNKQTSIMFLYLLSTIAVLKHMSLKENKSHFRKKSMWELCPFISMTGWVVNSVWLSGSAAPYRTEEALTEMRTNACQS